MNQETKSPEEPFLGQKAEWQARLYMLYLSSVLSGRDQRDSCQYQDWWRWHSIYRARGWNQALEDCHQPGGVQARLQILTLMVFFFKRCTAMISGYVSPIFPSLSFFFPHYLTQQLGMNYSCVSFYLLFLFKTFVVVKTLNMSSTCFTNFKCIQYCWL